MGVLQSYRDLDAWKRAVELAQKAYHVARNLPCEEKFEMSSQMRRAAVSIPSNIAEGYGRLHRKEYIQFLGIARASLAELQTLFILAVKLGLVKSEKVVDAFNESNEVGKILNKLHHSLSP